MKLQNQKPAFVNGYIQVDGALKEAVDCTRQRMLFAFAGLVIIFLMVAIRLINLGFAADEGVSRIGIPALTELEIQRGNIVDRNGTLISTNLSTASLYANPRKILDPQEAAVALHDIFPGLNTKTLIKKLSSEKSFVWLKRNLTPMEQYTVNNLGIPGILFKHEEKRVYPQGKLLSHALGLVGTDGKGLSGIEKTYNHQLMTKGKEDEPLALSFDVRVQSALHETLKDGMKEFKAKGAAGVVMDVHSGEILGMVSLPDFDPNQPGKVKQDMTFNRATLGAYEMGSTFKAFTTAMALDSGVARLRDRYDATKPIHFARHTIRDHHPESRWLTVPEIFMYSSNIGTARLAMELGEEKQKKFLKKLGLMDRMDIEIPEKSKPLTPATWREINTMTIGFGHGIAVSPLHIISAMATLVNGGHRIKPTLLKVEDGQHIPRERVFKDKTSDIMRKLLRLVVTDGTGKQAGVKGYLVGGKTGTAEKLKNGRYDRKAKISSFVGVFPMDEPRYAVFTMYDEPKGTKATFGFSTAGWTAAPAAAKVISRIAPILGIAPVDEDSKAVNAEFNMEKFVRRQKLASF